MFELLDDPAPPTPHGDAREAVARRMRALRRRRTARVGTALVVAAATIVVVALVRSTPDKPEVVPVDGPTTTTSTMRRPPVGVGGLLANHLEGRGPLNSWSLAFYPLPTAGVPSEVWLSVRDPDGPVPRIVSLDFGDGRVLRPPRPPCPPVWSQPVEERTGEHWFHSMRNSVGEPPALWQHAYPVGDKLKYTVEVVAESGCGAARRARSSAEFEVHVHRPWNDG